MMKKTFLVLATTFLFVATYAQESNFFVKGGVNIANISINDNGSYDDANSLVSFHAGIIADLPVSKYFSFQPGLLFTGKGTKVQQGQPSSASYFKATSNPYYVELPVNLVAKIPLASEGSNFFIGAGPYVAAGITGKNKAEGKIFGATFKSEKSIDFSNDNPTTLDYEEGAGFGIIKRFDYGLNGTAGFELNNLLLSVNYGYGLAKLNSNANNNNDKNKHRVLSFSVGFRL
jgi:hypothetical protein